MNNYFGRKELKNAIDRVNSNNRNIAKGLAGELSVGDLLRKYLPEDTYIIAHPQTGKYDPDIIVISPRYGFRIIEVKNWDINNIFSVDSNGTVYLTNRVTENPMSQVKKHRDEMWDYLSTKFGHTTTTVDCLVVHYGFTKQEFKRAFDNGWDPTFYKSTIFRDQLNANIDTVLRDSTKFTNKGIGIDKIQRIVNSVAISDKIFESETLNKEKQDVKKLIYVVIALLIVTIVGVFKVLPDMQAKNIQNQEVASISSESIDIDVDVQSTSNAPQEHADEATSISEIISDESNVGKEFELALLVTDFHYDSDSDTKFISLSDGQDLIDGVIFKNTPNIPYIHVNDSYIIVGILNVYNSKYQLIVNSIEE